MSEDEALWSTRGLRGTLLAAAAIGLILATVATFVWLEVDALRKRALCGKYMSQLMGAMIGYRMSDEGAAPPGVPPARAAGDAHAARRVTCQLFARVARQLSLPVFLYRCPGTAYPRPPDLAPGPIPVDWGLTGTGVVTYAYDWAMPEDPSADRVVFADRDPTAHGRRIVACFGDAHVRVLPSRPAPVARAPGALVTEGPDGGPVAVSAGDAGGDDAYSADGDGGDPLTPGKGDPLRAWVK
jgi:hypothetical protein